MARLTVPLTDTEIKNAKQKEKKYKLSDGGGLFLLIMPNGSKLWRLKYRLNDKEKEYSIGTYPTISLSKAREKREELKKLIADSIDPNENKKQIKEEAAIKEELITNAKTFKHYTEWYFKHIGDGLSESHLNRTRKGWNKDVLPAIGDKDINDVTASDIVKILRQMKERDARESARKVFGSIKKLYSLVISNYPDDVTRNPCSDINVSDVIGKKKENHYPIITDSKELQALFIAIDEYGGDISTRRALQLLPYVSVRPANIRMATWDEFNLVAKQWVIPASKLKTKKELIVPLAIQVVDMLLEWQAEATSELLFPSPRSRTSPLSDATLVGALRRLGYTRNEVVAHSFRGIFSTIAHEKSNFSHEAIETQLAHSVGNSVSQAYNRAMYLDERVELMQWYADYLEVLKHGN